MLSDELACLVVALLPAFFTQPNFSLIHNHDVKHVTLLLGFGLHLCLHVHLSVLDMLPFFTCSSYHNKSKLQVQLEQTGLTDTLAAVIILVTAVCGASCFLDPVHFLRGQSTEHTCVDIVYAAGMNKGFSACHVSSNNRRTGTNWEMLRTAWQYSLGQTVHTHADSTLHEVGTITWCTLLMQSSPMCKAAGCNTTASCCKTVV